MPDALGIGERPELPLGCDVGDRLSSGACLKQGSNLSADSLGPSLGCEICSAEYEAQV